MPFTYVSKRVLVGNFSFENEIDLHENEYAGETNFHMNGIFALRLVLTQRHEATAKSIKYKPEHAYLRHTQHF